MKKIILYTLLALIILIGIGLVYLNNNQDMLITRTMERTLQQSEDFRTELLSEKEGITVFTVGTATPLPSKRGQTCTAMFVNGYFFVFDVGDNAVKQMEEMNLPLADLDGIFLTHYHTDHYIDLPYLINRSWQMGRNTDLELYGPTGLDTISYHIDGFLAIENGHRVAHHGEEIMPSQYSRGIPNEFEMPKNGSKVVYEKDGIKITAFDVGHEPVTPDVGYKIEYNGKIVVLSGDTNKNDNVLAQSKGADLLLHEAMLMDIVQQISDNQKKLGNERNAYILHDIQEYHTSPQDAARIAQEAGVKELVLHHLGPVPDNFILKRRFQQSTKGLFDGKVTVAEDGDKFIVK